MTRETVLKIEREPRLHLTFQGKPVCCFVLDTLWARAGAGPWESVWQEEVVVDETGKGR